MSYVAASGGFRPRPVKRTFSYAELACGRGWSTVLLAAANPHARFIGIDASGEKVAAARELASACEVRNVEFLEAGMAQAAKKARAYARPLEAAAAGLPEARLQQLGHLGL